MCESHLHTRIEKEQEEATNTRVSLQDTYRNSKKEEQMSGYHIVAKDPTFNKDTCRLLLKYLWLDSNVGSGINISQ